MTPEQKKEWLSTALLAGICMLIGLMFLDQLIGDPARIG